MLRAGSSPGGQRPASALGWLLPTALTAVAAGVAVSVATPGVRVMAAWCGAAATVLVVAAEAVRRSRSLAALRDHYARQEDGLRSELARQEAELRYQLAQQEAHTVQLAEVLLPQAVARLQQGEFVVDVLKDIAADGSNLTPEFQAARLAVLSSVLEAVDAEEGLRESAQRAFVNIARRVQAIVHRQAQDLREMEDRHGNNPAVFDDLLQLDHGNALVGRLADSIAVLGGARPGRQWSKPVPLYSVLRGAVSRILDYQRVELHPVSDVAVVGHAVEPLIHALAELLDNATRYSPPQTNVHLTAVEVQTGIAIEIEDGGLSLSEEGRARAERMLKQAQAGLDLNDLGETPRLGLAVVGRLAQAYGLQVSLRPSAYGGVRAVLIVPQELITTAPATGLAHGIGASSGPRAISAARPAAGRAGTGPLSAAAPGQVARGSVAHDSVVRNSAAGSSAAGNSVVRNSGVHNSVAYEDDVPVVSERAANGLPQRRRHNAAGAGAGAVAAGPAPQAALPAQASAAQASAGQADGSAKEPEQPGLWLAAFQSGVNSQAPDAAPAGRNSDESSGRGEQ